MPQGTEQVGIAEDVTEAAYRQKIVRGVYLHLSVQMRVVDMVGEWTRWLNRNAASGTSDSMCREVR